MTNDKIKVKDLAIELGVSTKDLLRVLRELEISAKSTMSNISIEDLPKIRTQFNTPITNKEEERRQVQPGVILRRKRQQPSTNQINAELTPPDIKPTLDDETAHDLTTQEEQLISNDEKILSSPIEEPFKKPTFPKNERQHKSFVAKIVQYPTPSASTETFVTNPPQTQKTISEKDVIKNQDSPNKNTKQSPLQHTEKTNRKPAASAIPEGSSAPSLLPPVFEQTRRLHDEEVESHLHTERKVDLQQKEEQPTKVRVISKPNIIHPRSWEAHDSRSPNGQRATTEKQLNNNTNTNNREHIGNNKRATPYQGQNKNNFIPSPDIIPNTENDSQNKKKRHSARKSTDFNHKLQYDDDDGILRQNRGKKRPKQKSTSQITTQPIKSTKRKIRVEEAIRVADMAHQMALKANEIIKVLFNLGVMATINMSLDIDTATLVAAEFGYEVEKVGFTEEDYLTSTAPDQSESLKRRPPVVTIMGHVDHGKTSLLDAIRKTNVTGGEAGGITQHIGAYHVTTKSGEIVFLDTPGHEAFTTMRARGAQVTDIVVLVVAADDGVMEQTREAVNHARAANVPIMVAVNKMDKPEANPDRVLRELSEIGLVPEDWGGDTIVAKVSAKSLEGIDELLELLALQADILELKANPDKLARGHIVEAKLDKGRGPIATVLIQEGTLHQGDTFVCGMFSGRVRAMFNDQGKKVKEAGPSMPIEVQGFDGVPEAGEAFICLPDEKLARRIAESRAIKQREKELAKESKVTLETFLSKASSGQEVQILNLVVKSDVQGSLEAILEALRKISTDKVRINIIHGGSGSITESDILLASASDAIVIGFNVRPTAKVKEVAEQESVDIRFYDIIYKLVEEIKSAMTGLLAPISREVYLGQADVREIFNVPKIGTIAGSHVSDGKLLRNTGVRLLREGVVVYTGKIASLRRFKEDVREVQKGYECGISLENFNDIKLGDVIESFETIEEAAIL